MGRFFHTDVKTGRMDLIGANISAYGCVLCFFLRTRNRQYELSLLQALGNGDSC